MISPKDKAAQFVKLLTIEPGSLSDTRTDRALTTVHLIIEELGWVCKNVSDHCGDRLYYWEQVKKELEKQLT